MKHTSKLILVLALALAGCAGEDGTDGTNGTDGTSGTSGTDGADGTNGTDGTDGINGNPGTPYLGVQIDRVGRPAIGTALMDTFNGDSASKGSSKDAYNAAGPAAWPSFEGDFATSLAILDSLDTNCGNQLLADDANPNGRYAALAGILADDQLYVNTATGECGVYMGLEAEVVGALNSGEGKCGGRTPADDIIDRSYSVLAAGILTGVDDTIAVDDCTFSESFPFLCAPSS
jgi:hypothetical protein